MRFALTICALVATLLAVLEWRGFVEGECCGAECGGCSMMAMFCNDCTKATPYCGYEGCNIFGCNCGDCRTGKGCGNCYCPKAPPPPLMASLVSSSKPECRARKPQPSADELRERRRKSVAHVRRVMASADSDGDGRLSLRETQSWAEQNLPTQYNQAKYVSNKFSKLDTDQDGFVTPREIDPQSKF